MQRLIDSGAFAQLFEKGNMRVTDEMYSRFERYASLLCEWNEKINLTAITAPDEIAVKHFFDSVYPFTLADIPSGASLIDVGAGAGFPSLPLKIYRNDIRLTMVDGLNKRVNFLKETVAELGLEAECVHGRAEELGRTGSVYREGFELAAARAVANLKDLCEYCLPFVKVGGRFIALKGSGGEQELAEAKNAIRLLGGKVDSVKSYELPNGDARTLIVIAKTAETPQKYPRNAGQIKKKPL